MIALPPPPPPVKCLAPADIDQGSAYLVLSGDPAQLHAVLSTLRPPLWAVDARAINNGVSFARLKGSINMKYRDVGASIIEAQQRGLAVSFFTVPPICGPDDQ